MKIGLLTSGGDAPGMNAFISKFSTFAFEENFEIVAFKFGYQGLIDNNTFVLSKELVYNISHLGGSVLKSTRSSEFLTKQGLKKAIQSYKINELSALVVLGGDGTLMGAKELVKEGLKIIYIPSTIDNDISYSEQSLGFDSAVNAAVDAIDKIKQTMLSSNRIFICEVMGRHCDDIAKNCAIATDATILISSEKDCSLKQIVSKIKLSLKDGEESPSIIVKENITDIFSLAKQIQNNLDIETRACKIGYVQRGTQPSVVDRILARNFARETITLLKNKKYNKALCVIKGKITSKNINDI